MRSSDVLSDVKRGKGKVCYPDSTHNSKEEEIRIPEKSELYQDGTKVF